MTAKSPLTVIHVTGLWRSGSTILDIIVGSHDMVEGVGELRHLLPGLKQGLACACGESAEQCPFWSAVLSRWLGVVGRNGPSRLIQLQERFERTRSMPLLLASGIGWRSPALQEYGRLMHALYSSISETGGKRVIVDSSKYPGRALALSRIPSLDVKIVHLVRDGRAVIWSWRRMANTDLQGNTYEVDPVKVARMTTYSWLGVNLYTGLARRLAASDTIRIRYEDLIADPRAELQRIGKLVDLDYGEIADRLTAGRELRVGHPVAGNRVRHSGTIRLRPDLEWEEKLTDGDRREFWKRAGWLARRYGYR